MIIKLSFHSKSYQADLHRPLDISLPIMEGASNPNCYWADPVKFETIAAGDFIGSVKAGGPVNYQRLTVTPHGNGTHTECYGHISADAMTINQSLNRFHFIAELISVVPEKGPHGDSVITEKQLHDKIRFSGTEALVIRTLPNDTTKRTRQYSGTNPPYFEANPIKFVVSRGVQHVLTDLPSLDKEVDQGRLSAHKAFWYPQETVQKNNSITELIFVDDAIPDGLYLLNLQIASLEMDASPSKPVLYKLEEVL